MSCKEITQLSELNELCQMHQKVLVDFHASWCGPCKAITPYMVQQCLQQQVHLVKVDVDQGPEIAQKYDVQAMPTLKILDVNGDVKLTKVGGGRGNVDACIMYYKDM